MATWTLQRALRGVLCLGLLWAVTPAQATAPASAASVMPPAAADTVLAHDQRTGAGKPSGAAEIALFDGSGDARDCAATFARLRRQALAGRSGAQLRVGALYLRGQRCGRFDLPIDDGLAAQFLAHAAIQGRFPAMAAMAELELRRHQSMAANVWAQVYVHFMAPHLSASGRGYLGSLLQRTLPLLDTAERRTLLVNANGFIAAYASSIEQGLLRRAQRPRRGDPVCRVHPEFKGGFLPSENPVLTHSAMLLYWLAVDRNGRVRALAPVLQLSGAGYARYADRAVERVRFNPAPQCAQPLRYTLYGVFLNNGNRSASLPG